MTYYRKYMILPLTLLVLGACSSYTNHQDDKSNKQIDSLLKTYNSIQSHKITQVNHTIRISLSFSDDRFKDIAYSTLIHNQLCALLKERNETDSVITDFDLKNQSNGFTIGTNIKTDNVSKDILFSNCNKGAKLLQYFKDSISYGELKILNEYYSFIRNRYYQLHDSTSYPLLFEESGFTNGLVYGSLKRCNSSDTTLTRKEKIFLGTLYYTIDNPNSDHGLRKKANTIMTIFNETYNN